MKLTPQYPHLSFMDLSQGKEWHYHPKDDITILELANLMELFTYSAHYKGAIQWLLYIEKKKLERHFECRMIGDYYDQVS